MNDDSQKFTDSGIEIKKLYTLRISNSPWWNYQVNFPLPAVYRQICTGVSYGLCGNTRVLARLKKAINDIIIC
jgi:hypothetical protein